MYTIDGKTYNNWSDLREEMQENGIELGTYFLPDDESGFITDVISKDNHQKIMSAVIAGEDDTESAFKAELQLVLTDKYFDWHNTLADKIVKTINNYLVLDEELDEESADWVKEYNVLVKYHNRHFGLDLEFIDDKEDQDYLYDVVKLIENNSTKILA
jgi:hypothetical protein